MTTETVVARPEVMVMFTLGERERSIPEQRRTCIGHHRSQRELLVMAPIQ